jgi:hypothetical protein
MERTVVPPPRLSDYAGGPDRAVSQRSVGTAPEILGHENEDNDVAVEHRSMTDPFHEANRRRWDAGSPSWAQRADTRAPGGSGAEISAHRLSRLRVFNLDAIGSGPPIYTWL